jgi:hypothetical protein
MSGGLWSTERFERILEVESIPTGILETDGLAATNASGNDADSCE